MILWAVVTACLFSSVIGNPAPEPYFDYYNNWPPCGYQQPWNPPMQNYHPCSGFGYGPPPGLPERMTPLENRLMNYDDWDGLLYPDCCVDNCLPECDYYYDYGIPEPNPDPQPPVSDCPWTIPGWAMIDGQEIYLSEVKTGLSWFEADAKSVEVGGYLMEITSPSESSLLRRLEKCYPQGTKFWIGGNDLAQNGRWVWSRGRLIQGYVNYANYGQDQSGHCLEARSPSFQWFRSSCHGDGGSHAFLVEKDHSSNPTPPRPPPRTTTTTTRSTTRTTARPTFGPGTTTASGNRPTPVK